MTFPSIRKIFATLAKAAVALFALFYLVGVYLSLQPLDPLEPAPLDSAPLETIAIFGASGTAGDGILKAALADPDVKNIHVITRRSTPRIEAGIAAGKVIMTQHMDYLDYSALQEVLADVDTVYWAIGISAMGANEDSYRRIHTGFPAQFLTEWLAAGDGEDKSFQFISSSDISEDSDTMWVREKIRAEKVLFGLAEDTSLRVIAYRPDYIGPAKDEAHLGQSILYGFFRPVGAAVRASDIGRAMLEVTVRGQQLENGSKLNTRSIHRYSNAYRQRTGQ